MIFRLIFRLLDEMLPTGCSNALYSTLTSSQICRTNNVHDRTRPFIETRLALQSIFNHFRGFFLSFFIRFAIKMWFLSLCFPICYCFTLITHRFHKFMIIIITIIILIYKRGKWHSCAALQSSFWITKNRVVNAYLRWRGYFCAIYFY